MPHQGEFVIKDRKNYGTYETQLRVEENSKNYQKLAYLVIKIAFVNGLYQFIFLIIIIII